MLERKTKHKIIPRLRLVISAGGGRTEKKKITRDREEEISRKLNQSEKTTQGNRNTKIKRLLEKRTKED